MAKHFLYLTNDKLVALVWKGGTIVERDVFVSTELATPHFAKYVDKHREISTFVVTDLIEEDFRLDTVPHLRGNDQTAVMDRKLSQLYRASQFRHGIIQGRETEGRRDNKVLYHAVTNAETLKPILAALEEAKAPLESISSSAVLSGRLLASLNAFTQHTLLVMIVPDFGLRQTYFQNKQIKFSRLTPIALREGQSAGELIAAEASRTWQYLDSLRFFASGETLEVLVLVNEGDRQMLADAIRTYPLIQFRFLDIEEVAQKLKMKPAPASSHADGLLVHVYAQEGVENHFATPEQRRFAIYKRVRFGLFAIAAGIIAVCTVAASYNLFEAGKISSEIDLRTAQAKPLQAEFRAVVNEMSKQTTASETVRDSSAFYNQFMRPSPPSPGNFVRAFSQVLTEFPNVQLQQLVWAPVGDANATPTYAAIAVQGAGSLQSVTKVGNATAAANANVAATAPAPAQPFLESDPPFSDGKYQALIVEAAINPFDGNHRKAITEINNFVVRLNQLPSVTASIVTPPVDVQTNATITATDALSSTVRPSANFTLKLIRGEKVAKQ